MDWVAGMFRRYTYLKDMILPSFTNLLRTCQADYLNHHKYFNNYEYNKSIFLVNRVPHFDNGFLLMLTESKSLVSAISVLHYEKYTSKSEVEAIITENEDKIQCIVSIEEVSIQRHRFRPGLHSSLASWDYADSVDTMAFLSAL
jgi:hypothetical protein